MLGNSSDISNKTEENNVKEACFGGFESRFSYESCRKSKSTRYISFIIKALAMLSTGAFFALFGLASGATIMMILTTNKGLYYPLEEDKISSVEDFYSELPMSSVPKNEIVSIVNGTLQAESISDEVSTRFRVPIGIMLHELDEKSAPYFAGIRAGDIIVAIDGVALSSIDMLDNTIACFNSGDKPVFTVFRDNAYMDFIVNVE